MQGLSKFAARENLDPNTRIVKVVDQQTGMTRLEHQQVSANFEAQSIKSGRYQWSAIGEMNNEQLDQLNALNKERQARLEEEYKASIREPDPDDEEEFPFTFLKQIVPPKVIMREMEGTSDPRERHKDASINYPSYGRGLPPPSRELNTYMINPGMCADPKQKARQASGSGSPKPGVQAMQRKRILSPRRQKFETQFEEFLTRKRVEDKLADAPPPELDFDTTTKPEGTVNTKVNKKTQWLEEDKKR